VLALAITLAREVTPINAIQVTLASAFAVNHAIANASAVT
jgi:hypothetical protein